MSSRVNVGKRATQTPRGKEGGSGKQTSKFSRVSDSHSSALPLDTLSGSTVPVLVAKQLALVFADEFLNRKLPLMSKLKKSKSAQCNNQLILSQERRKYRGTAYAERSFSKFTTSKNGFSAEFIKCGATIQNESNCAF